MHRTNDCERWGRALVGLLMVLVVAGCGSKKALSGEAVDVDDEEVQAMAALIEKAWRKGARFSVDPDTAAWARSRAEAASQP